MLESSFAADLKKKNYLNETRIQVLNLYPGKLLKTDSKQLLDLYPTNNLIIKIIFTIFVQFKKIE